MSRSALSHMLALVAQDTTRVNQFFNHPQWGFRLIFENFQNYFNYFGACGGHWSDKPGISFEHNRRGSYGRGVIKHGFHAFANLAMAARTGGNPAWDILETATGSAAQHLEDMLDTWIGVSTFDHQGYINWAQCRESNSPTQTTSGNLGASYWTSLESARSARGATA